MGRFKLLPVFALAVLAIGCGDDESPAPGDPPSDELLLQYSRTGGLAFSIYEIRIEDDGTGVIATGNDASRLDRRSFQLTDAELAHLMEILDANPIDSLPDPGDDVCADCFEYGLAYDGGEYSFSDASELSDAVTEVTSFLYELPLPADRPAGG